MPNFPKEITNAQHTKDAYVFHHMQQNAHYSCIKVKHLCIHPPKVFIQSWINVTQLGKRKTWGYVNQEIGIQNIKEENKSYHMDIHYKDNRKYKIGGGTYTEE